jgi:hypothetical protein
VRSWNCGRLDRRHGCVMRGHCGHRRDGRYDRHGRHNGTDKCRSWQRDRRWRWRRCGSSRSARDWSRGRGNDARVLPGTGVVFPNRRNCRFLHRGCRWRLSEPLNELGDSTRFEFRGCGGFGDRLKRRLRFRPVGRGL